MDIAIVGAGYVGLSLAALLAKHNHVTVVDIAPEKSTPSIGDAPLSPIPTLRTAWPAERST